MMPKVMSGNIMPIVILLAIVISLFPVQASSETIDAVSSGKILTIRLQKAISLEDLLLSSGYSLSDDIVYSFLSDFLSLNPGIKSISSISKGTVVRVPLKNLGRTASASPIFRQKAELAAVRKKIIRKRVDERILSETKPVDRSVLLRNIRELFLFLGNDITIEREGFRYFPLSEKSDFAFDSGVFPIIDLHDNRILVIDYNGEFPEEIRNMLEISWPEYRLVRLDRRNDMRTFTGTILKESGYQVNEDARIVSGGTSQIEYRSDYIVQGKSGGPFESDISLVSIISGNELRTPDQLISWFRDRDVKVFEISDHERTFLNRNPGVIIDAAGMEGTAFVRTVIEASGYPFTTNEQMGIKPQRGLNYRINADILIDLGYRKKIIQFSDVSEQEASYIRRLGLDVAHIEPWEAKQSIAKKIMSLLSLEYSDKRMNNSAFLGPKNTRYRLLLPGFAAKSFKGRLFITDTDIDAGLLQSIMNEGISVLRF